MGAFFSQAHMYEAETRERLALLQTSAEEVHRVRNSAVQQFRKDAAAAAPAFFNLGRALERSGQDAEAVQAYSDYIAWADDASRIIHWSREIPPRPLEPTLGKPDPGMHWPHPAYEEILTAVDPRQWPAILDRGIVASDCDGSLFVLERHGPDGKYVPYGDRRSMSYQVVCLDRDTGEERWRNKEAIPVGAIRFCDPSITATESSLFILLDEALIVLKKKRPEAELYSSVVATLDNEADGIGRCSNGPVPR